MKIALHIGDIIKRKKPPFPNLALMKLSAWHKAKGDSVEWYFTIAAYDRVYSSKVFTFTDADPYLPENTVKRGTGYGVMQDLPEEIEHIAPDYALYPAFDSALGFTTRGCIRNCPWCIVPQKEGQIRAHAHPSEFVRKDSRHVTLMDNNILAHQHGRDSLLWLAENRYKVDCNQGLDARLIDRETAELLSRVKWAQYIRLACDTTSALSGVISAIENLRAAGHSSEIFCYVLVKDIPDALDRVETLRRLNVAPFAQPFRDFSTNAEPDKELRHFARWVNHKAIFKSTTWKEYNTKGTKE